MKAMRDGRNDMGCLIWAYERSPLELLKKGNDIAGYAGLVLPRSAEDREAPDMDRLMKNAKSNTINP